MKPPLLAAYIAKQQPLVEKLPKHETGMFLGVVADFNEGKKIGLASLGMFRLNKTPNLVEYLGVELTEARAIGSADMAEWKAAIAEYTAATA